MSRRAAPLGAGFGRLWTGATMGNLGDGTGRVAVALLAAALTRDPLAVAAVTALSYLPWLILGLPSGVLVDRYDRRTLAVLAGSVRAGAITVLATAAATDRASLWLLYAVVLVLYSCETLYDNAVLAMVPMVVTDRDHLERANGRIQGGAMVAQQFLGPPLAGMVFALAAAYAFGLTAACYALAAVLLLSLRRGFRAGRVEPSESTDPDGATERHDRAEPPGAAQRLSLWQEMADGVGYVRRHPLHRRLLALLMAIGFGGALVNATNVLWTLDVLGVSEAWFGVFTLTLAVGALLGSQSAAAVTRRLGRAGTLRLAIATMGVGGLVAAATTSPYPAGVGLAMVGWSALVFNVVNVSLRQRLTPAAMLGRVMGIYMAAAVGVMVLGALAGGIVASLGGLRLPWLLLGLGSVTLAALAVRWLRDDVLERALTEADHASASERAAEPGRTAG